MLHVLYKQITTETSEEYTNCFFPPYMMEVDNVPVCLPLQCFVSEKKL